MRKEKGSEFINKSKIFQIKNFISGKRSILTAAAVEGEKTFIQILEPFTNVNDKIDINI